MHKKIFEECIYDDICHPGIKLTSSFSYYWKGLKQAINSFEYSNFVNDINFWANNKLIPLKLEIGFILLNFICTGFPSEKCVKYESFTIAYDEDR